MQEYTLTIAEVAYILLGDEAEEVLRLSKDEVYFKRFLVDEALENMHAVDEDEFTFRLSVNKPPTFHMAVIQMYDRVLYRTILYTALRLQSRIPFLSTRQSVYHVCSRALALSESDDG